jgi:hypothetical protein
MKNNFLSVVVAYLLPSTRRGLGLGVEDKMMHSKIFSHAEGNLATERTYGTLLLTSHMLIK